MSAKTIFVSVVVLLLTASSCWAVYCTSAAAVSTNGVNTSSDADQDWGYPTAACSSGTNNGHGTQAGASAWGYVSHSGFDAKCSATTWVARTQDDASASATASPFYFLAGAVITGNTNWVIAPVMPTAQLSIGGGGGGGVAVTSLGFDFKVNGSTVLGGWAQLNSFGGLYGAGIYAPANWSRPMMDGEGNWHAEYIGGEQNATYQVNSFFDVYTELGVRITKPTGSMYGGSSFQQVQWVLPDGYDLSVPEPSSIAGLLIPGALALLLRRRR